MNRRVNDLSISGLAILGGKVISLIFLKVPSSATINSNVTWQTYFRESTLKSL